MLVVCWWFSVNGKFVGYRERTSGSCRHILRSEVKFQGSVSGHVGKLSVRESSWAVSERFMRLDFAK